MAAFVASLRDCVTCGITRHVPDFGVSVDLHKRIAAWKNSKVNAFFEDLASTEVKLYRYEDVPHFLRQSFIRRGYRMNLSPVMCLRSVFWWTNETINIWSHLAGYIFFLALYVYDVFYIINQPNATLEDKVLITFIMLNFQFCMLCSAAYHTFSCVSPEAQVRWLLVDVFGITCSMTAVFVSGISVGFHCYPWTRWSYLLTVCTLFGLVVSTHVHPKYKAIQYQPLRVVLLFAWAIYGLVPTGHFIYLNFYNSSTVIESLLPRIWWMYFFGGIAFFFYTTHYPERIFPGTVDFFGSSHHFWHVLSVVAFYWWHNTIIQSTFLRTHDICPRNS